MVPLTALNFFLVTPRHSNRLRISHLEKLEGAVTTCLENLVLVGFTEASIETRVWCLELLNELNLRSTGVKNAHCSRADDSKVLRLRDNQLVLGKGTEPD